MYINQHNRLAVNVEKLCKLFAVASPYSSLFNLFLISNKCETIHTVDVSNAMLCTCNNSSNNITICDYTKKDKYSDKQC